MHATRILILAALAAALAQPRPAAADVKVWNYEVPGDAYRVTDPPPLGPITILATRHGTFSGAVAVESTEPITGLRASAGPLAAAGGAALPAARLAVRYVVRWPAARRAPGGLDILLESPPAEVAADRGRALAGVWLTVTVPQDAAPGLYRGHLTVQADGLAPRKVPVELDVVDWAPPDSDDWRTWIEIIQSPDTLAMEYGVPLWSERHWDLIANSFRLIRPSGSRVVYVPVLRNTNQGNAESMVRWIRRKDGTFQPDFSVMEKYLDVAQENLGEIKLLVFYIWDSYLVLSWRRESYVERPAEPGLARDRWDLRQQGLIVTIVDEATGKTEPGGLPHYTAPESRAIWKPFYDELRQRMRRRGIEKAMALGIVHDYQPSKTEVEFLQDVTGGLPWIAHSHYRRTSGRPWPNKILYDVAGICYEAHAYGLVYHVNPDIDPIYGWRVPELRVYVDRFGLVNGPALRIRQMPQLNITGDQRGMGRAGGDFWPVIKDGRGRRAGQVFERYPENHWRGLNISNWLLAPGPDGPVATARLENLREGLQECEARILIEGALLDAAQKQRLGAELAARAQAALNEHERALWHSFWSDEKQLAMLGSISGRSMYEGLWNGLKKAGVSMPGFWDSAARKRRSDEGVIGLDWFVGSGWKARNKELFEVAAEVQRRLR